MLSTELTNGAQRQETIQNELISALEREKKLKNENISLLEKMKKNEKEYAEIKKQVEIQVMLKDNKHNQLLNTIIIVHR
jgi:predicted  nucleic acid-binding Zn-ribbon protein